MGKSLEDTIKSEAFIYKMHNISWSGKFIFFQVNLFISLWQYIILKKQDKNFDKTQHLLTTKTLSKTDVKDRLYSKVAPKISLPVCCCCCFVASRVGLSAALWTVAPGFPCPWNFSGKNTWVWCHFLLLEIFLIQFSSGQSLSHIQIFETPWTAARRTSLDITNPLSLLKLMSIESVKTSNQIILCRPLLFLPSIFPSIRVFSNEPVLCIRWPKYWSFSFNISPSNEYSGLISFRMDWLDLFAVQGTPKSLLQHHSPKASILWCSAFFIVQFSHPL